MMMIVLHSTKMQLFSSLFSSLYVSVGVRACVNVCLSVCVPAYVRACVRAYVHKCVCMCVCMCVYCVLTLLIEMSLRPKISFHRGAISKNLMITKSRKYILVLWLHFYY